MVGPQSLCGYAVAQNAPGDGPPPGCIEIQPDVRVLNQPTVDLLARRLRAVDGLEELAVRS